VANRIIVKQVVYDEFMKQIRDSFNTTCTANYRVKLTVSPSTKNNYNNPNHNNNVFKKKLTNKCTKKLATRVGTIVDQKKSTGVVQH